MLLYPKTFSVTNLSSLGRLVQEPSKGGVFDANPRGLLRQRRVTLLPKRNNKTTTKQNPK